MKNTVRLAAVAVDTKPNATAQNTEKIAEWTARAADAGAELVAFQELSATGFLPNHPIGNHDRWLREALRVARQIAEPVEPKGALVARLSDIARRHDVLLAAGMLEDAGNLLFNTQVLVGKDGVLGRWRKMHIPTFEMPFYIGGGAPAVVDTKLGRIGVNICFDALFPESTRLLAARNVEIVLFPFAADPEPVTPAGWAAWAGPPLRARCVENGVYGLASNYVGQTNCAGVDQFFPGGALAIDPRGQLVAEGIGEPGEPSMLVVDFTAEGLREARSEPEYLYRFRRPELYGPLACQ